MRSLSSMNLQTSNIFAALDTKKKKKSSSSSKDHDKKSSKEHAKKSVTAQAVSALELEKAIFSQPAIGVSNWADDDDEDEDFTPVDAANGWSKVCAGKVMVVVVVVEWWWSEIS